jgi:hypothetical protein
MKPINFKKGTFFIATFLYVLLTYLTLFVAAAIEEGTFNQSFILENLAKLYPFLRFPIHVFFFNYMDGIFFFVGLLINSILFGFITERVTWLIKPYKSD